MTVNSMIITLTIVIGIISILEIISINGRMNGIVNSMLATVVFFMIISPVCSFILSDFNTDTLENYNFSLDTNYILSVRNEEVLMLKHTVNTAIKEEVGENIVVDFSYELEENEISFKFVSIYLHNMVLNSGFDNININVKEKLRDIIQRYINIQKEQIVFYE